MNIVFFYFDEMRQDALSVYNRTYRMHTPNVERIASRGTVYENCFCTSPLCVPSRSSLLTCQYPERTAIYGNEAMFPSFHMDTVPDTFVRILENHGYSTASFGKTHVPPPLDQFQVNNPQGGEMDLGLSAQERQALEKITPPGELSFNAASLYPEGKDYQPEAVTQNAIDGSDLRAAPSSSGSHIFSHTPPSFSNAVTRTCTRITPSLRPEKRNSAASRASSAGSAASADLTETAGKRQGLIITRWCHGSTGRLERCWMRWTASL